MSRRKRKRKAQTRFHIRHYPLKRSWFVLRRGALDIVQVGDARKVLAMLHAELGSVVGI